MATAKSPQARRTGIVGRLRARLLSGEWTTKADAEAMGLAPSSSALSYTLGSLRKAGYEIESEPIGGGRMRYRARVGHRKADVPTEVAGLTHPALGTVLTVRALVLGDDGELVVQLTNGAHAWAATIRGHVEQ